MKIAIDATVLSYNNEGIGNYVRGLASGLATGLAGINSEIEKTGIELVWLHWDDLGDEDRNLLSGFETHELKQVSGPLSGFRTGWQLRQATTELGCDFLLSTHSHIVTLLAKRCIYLVHDIGPILYPHLFQTRISPIFKALFKQALRNSDLTLTTSNTARAEIIDLLHLADERVVAIGGSWNQNLGEAGLKTGTEDDILSKYQLTTEDYFLSIGTISPRKNYELAIKAAIKADAKLVIAGKQGWDFDSVIELAESHPENILITGYIPDAELAVLLANSKALVASSVYEGLDIPTLEAALIGKPVIASDTPIHREICGDGGIFFASGDKLSELMRKSNLKTITDAQQQQLKLKYNWENVARNLVTYLKTHLET